MEACFTLTAAGCFYFPILFFSLSFSPFLLPIYRVIRKTDVDKNFPLISSD